MKRYMYFFVIIFSFFICLSWISPVRAEMIMELCIGGLSNAPSEEDLERYYLGVHGPEVVRTSGPWIRRYQVWLPYVPPDDAVERFGAVRGRYVEMWFGSVEEYLDRPGMGGGENLFNETPPITNNKGGAVLPWEEENPDIGPDVKRVLVMVPAKPTETFFNSSPEREDTKFIRWVTAIRYPEGVSVEDGEKWFLEVHAREAVKQPGLLKFVSYRVMEELSKNKMPWKIDRMWSRINEYWYEDFDAWRKAVIESPPEYTSPSWGGEYPFVEMRSTFIPYMPYYDFLKGNKGDYVGPPE